MVGTSEDLSDSLNSRKPRSSRKADAAEGALDEGLRAGSAVLCQQVFFDRPGVDADPQGGATGFRGGDDLADLFTAQVSRVDPDGVGAVLHGGDGQAVVEVNIGDRGDPDRLPDGLDGCDGIVVENGNPDDLAAGLLEPSNLADGSLHVPGVRGRHGLDRHGGIAAYGHASHADLPRFFPCDCRRFAHEFTGLYR